MNPDPRKQTLQDLRRESKLLRAWLRDVKISKLARLRQITQEIHRRKSGPR